MSRDQLVDALIEHQGELYSEAIRLAQGLPIVFRLLDIGGDKVIPYLRSEVEENPAMGFRSLRLALDRPGLVSDRVLRTALDDPTPEHRIALLAAIAPSTAASPPFMSVEPRP